MLFYFNMWNSYFRNVVSNFSRQNYSSLFYQYQSSIIYTICFDFSAIANVIKVHKVHGADTCAFNNFI